MEWDIEDKDLKFNGLKDFIYMRDIGILGDANLMHHYFGE